MVVERGQRATRRSVDALAKDEQVEATGLVADREDWGVVAVPPKPKSKPRALPHSLPHTQMAGSVIVATMLASCLIPIGVFLVAVMGRISDLSPYWWGLIVVAGLFCLLPLARWLLFRRRLRNLVNYGAIVEGEVIDVAQDSVSGLYRTYCQACPPGSSTPIKFISGSHRYDPARHHRDFSAIRLPVYLDPERPVWRYFVDDSEMCDQWTPAPGWRGVAPRQYPVMPKIRTATTPKPTIRTTELDFAYSAAGFLTAFALLLGFLLMSNAPLAGSLLFVAGGLCWLPVIGVRLRRQRFLNRLRLRPGRITAVERQDRFGDKIQWRVRCEVYPPGSEQPIDCYSDPWPRDLVPVLNRLALTHLPVHLDPTDVERYFVDLYPFLKQYDAHPESAWPAIDANPRATSKDSTNSPTWSTYPSPSADKQG